MGCFKRRSILMASSWATMLSSAHTVRVAQILSEPPGVGLQSEEEIGTIAKEARIPVMTNQADDIDDLAGEC